jgi:hypothetical protein
LIPKWLERIIHWLEKNEPRKEQKMTYVPVKLWVPDTADASGTTPAVDEIQLKLCGTCFAPVPNHFMDAHVAEQHPEAPPTEPANPIAEPPPVAGQH